MKARKTDSVELMGYPVQESGISGYSVGRSNNSVTRINTAWENEQLEWNPSPQQ